MENYTTQVPGDKSYQSTSINVRLNTEDIMGLIKWAKFRGIMDIIFGILTSLGFITAIIGIPQIIAGVKLLNSVSALRQYIYNGQEQNVITYFEENRKFFLFSGITVIIKLIFTVISLILYISFFAIFMANYTQMPEFEQFFEQFGNTGVTYHVLSRLGLS